jgi:hypothetical protein
MNKSTLEDALACFERFEIHAEIDDAAKLAGHDTILVQTSNPDIYVQISTQEIIWRADQHLELLDKEKES